MEPALQFVLLFSAATAVAIATRWLRVPYTVALVLGGLALGALPLASRPHLTRDLLFAVALPGLLFEAAVHLREDDLAGSTLGIAALAVPGIVVILAATAPLMHALVPRLALIDALAFAAATVATDPIAVVATFREVNAPRRLAALVEGESLFNDGTGVVVFNLVVAAAAGAALSLGSAALQFVLVSAGGALVGGVLALVIVAVLRKAFDPMIEVTLTVIAAYGSFALAERVHASGVIAAVVAGLVCGRAGRRGVPASLDVLHTFWEYVAFALNSIVFLLIGLEVKPLALLRDWAAILLAYAVVTGVRFAVVFGTAALLRRTRERQPWRWTVVASWSGLRGALAMVLALSVPESFRARNLIIHLTFGVVLLSIVVQGLTMGKLLRWLRVAEPVSDPAKTAAPPA
ncbi:MAG TPA: cation:proton antiporter [Myxococcales bacterium]